MKTFLQLQQEVLRYFDLAAEPSSSADVELVKTALNTANQNRVSEDNWKFLLSSVYTLDIVSGTQEYILPHYNFGKFHYLYSTTFKRFANSTTMRQVPYSGVGFNDQLDGDNLYYDIIEHGSVVAVQPPTSDTLTLTSTSTETTTPMLYVEGEDSNGDLVSETIGTNQTTTSSFAKVTYYAKTDDFQGTITLSTTGGTDLVSLTASQYSKQYPVIRWHNIPVSNESYQYRFFRSPRVMERDYDIPDLPFPHSNILVYDTLLDLATYNEIDSESVNIWREKQNAALANLYLYKLNGNTVAGFGDYIVETGMM